MFEDLNAVLNYDASAPPAQGLTLIKCAAPTSEGALLVHHFVSLYLQAGCPVCLCAFEQDLAHYTAVSKKMGVNLTAEAAAGRFVFVDGFSNPYAGPGDVEAGGCPSNLGGLFWADCNHLRLARVPVLLEGAGALDQLRDHGELLVSLLLHVSLRHEELAPHLPKIAPASGVSEALGNFGAPLLRSLRWLGSGGLPHTFSRWSRAAWAACVRKPMSSSILVALARIRCEREERREGREEEVSRSV